VRRQRRPGGRDLPRDHRRVAVAEPPAGTESQRECHRGPWCTGYRLIPGDNGTTLRVPGVAHAAFCLADTALIAARLHPRRGLPAAYWWLRADLGNPVRRGEMVRVPFGPRMLLSEYYDMLMRRITEVLCSWERRVREVHHLSDPVPEADGHKVVARAAATIGGERLSSLLACPPEPMLRRVPSGELKAAEGRVCSPVLALWQDAILHDNANGTAVIRASLSGAGAGTEILDLFSRCLSALGQVAPPAELLDGVPCRSCDAMGLERAEPPSDPEIPAMHSRCPVCRAEMDLATYRDWSAWYSEWAKGLGPVTCQRCLNADRDPGRHSHRDCIYGGCECAARGHPRAG